MHPLGQFALFALPPPPWRKTYRWWELQDRDKNTSLANRGWVHSLVLTPSVTWTRSSALSIPGGYPLSSKEGDPQTTSDFMCLPQSSSTLSPDQSWKCLGVSFTDNKAEKETDWLSHHVCCLGRWGSNCGRDGSWGLLNIGSYHALDG